VHALVRRDFRVEKLSDEFGHHDLILKCEACGHELPLVAPQGYKSPRPVGTKKGPLHDDPESAR
jgi:hypothetical protein